MIAAARLLGPAALCVALLAAGGWTGPADAQTDTCKANPVTATGKAKFRPLSKTKELEGRGSAMEDAVASWQREVGIRHGDQWKTWDKAKDKSFDCAPTKSERLGLPAIGCTISGRPCASPPGSSARVAPPKERPGENRDRSRDRPPPETQGPPTGNSASAYAREMERQDQLAAQRRKAESDAYEREMAIQRKQDEQRMRNPRQ